MKLKRPYVFKWELLQEKCPCCGKRLKATDLIASPSGKFFAVVMCRNAKCTVRPKIRFEGDRASAITELLRTCQKGGAK